jgi:hypothetical protein
MSRRLKEERRRELARQRLQRRLLIGIPLALILLALGFLVYDRFLQDIQGVEAVDGLERGHDAEIVINSEGLPPVGGTHNPQWLNCGIYDDPVENALAVHSLEHGAVWLTYNPDAAPDQIAALEAYADTFTLVSPYPDQESDFAASAWGVQLKLDSLPDDRLDQFIGRYKGQGPEAGASCSGGVGTPRQS